jgi:hypothetical protein
MATPSAHTRASPAAGSGAGRSSRCKPLAPSKIGIRTVWFGAGIEEMIITH